MSDKRDAVDDLKVCESAEKLFGRDPNLSGWMDMAMPRQLVSFVRCSSEALPYWIRRAQRLEEVLKLISYQPCSNKKNKEMYGSCRQSPDCLTEYCLPCIAKAALDSVRY